ncbi:hypothetical protein [Roseomonas sp. 18066]|uniref:hypothetical protein n=1 Tax=Roseomonas sp. 18066 TaxID=2681412 RepID=UPI00135C0782|nr:hypothetical protein [Roseomonas sp. 18066]
MTTIRVLAAVLALLLAGGEIARRIAVPGGFFPGIFPLAMDEFAIAALLGWAAWRGSAGALLAAWMACAGLLLGLLAANAAPLLGGAPKPGAATYTIALSVLLAVAGWAAWRSGRGLRG